MSKKNWIFLCVVSLSLCLSIANAAEEEGLVAYWPMDEDRGDTIKDVSGNGNDGKIEGGVKWVDGVVGKALEFDGVSGVVNCGNDASLYTTTKQCALMLWFKPTEDVKPGDARQNILYHAGAPMFGFNATGAWNVREKPGALMAWTDGPGDTPQTILNSKRTSWSKGEWHHAAFVYDGSECKLYVDGQEEDNLPAKGEIKINPNAWFAIGASSWNSAYFRGVVDGVKYYSRALSDIEIASYLAVEHQGKLASTWGDIKAKF